jgi:hypothetical protein
VERRPLDGHAATAIPDPVEVDVGEETTAVVEQPLSPDRIGVGSEGRSDPGFEQRPHGVGGR